MEVAHGATASPALIPSLPVKDRQACGVHLEACGVHRSASGVPQTIEQHAATATSGNRCPASSCHQLAAAEQQPRTTYPVCANQASQHRPTTVCFDLHNGHHAMDHPTVPAYGPEGTGWTGSQSPQVAWPRRTASCCQEQLWGRDAAVPPCRESQPGHHLEAAKPTSTATTAASSPPCTLACPSVAASSLGFRQASLKALRAPPQKSMPPLDLSDPQDALEGRALELLVALLREVLLIERECLFTG